MTSVLTEALYASRTRRVLLDAAQRVVHNDTDAEDCVQDALLLAWKHAGQLRSQMAVTPWLRQVVTNTARMWIRDRKRMRRGGDYAHVDVDDGPPLVAAEDPERDVIRDQFLGAIERALEDEPAIDVQVFLEAASGEELTRIAERLGATKESVKSRLHRIRRRLRDQVT